MVVRPWRLVKDGRDQQLQEEGELQLEHDRVPVLMGVEDAPGVVDADRDGVVEEPRRVVLRRGPGKELVVLPVGGLYVPPPLVPS